VSQRSNLAALTVLNRSVVACRRCDRLVVFREQIGQIRRRAYREQEYWSKAVPGFGDPRARLLIVGLAPGAHGSNRTGRMFTGDRSGDFLYPALFETGFANQPTSVDRSDGLELHDAYITAAVRCVPPDNKPEPEEILACRPYLIRELALLKNVQVVVALGAIGMNAYLSALLQQGFIESRSMFPFAHGACYQTHGGGPALLASYHPSQQNTATKRLTAEMLRRVFLLARSLFHD
jgi:uracil-DNA glycosylase